MKLALKSMNVKSERDRISSSQKFWSLLENYYKSPETGILKKPGLLEAIVSKLLMSSVLYGLLKPNLAWWYTRCTGLTLQKMMRSPQLDHVTNSYDFVSTFQAL